MLIRRDYQDYHIMKIERLLSEEYIVLNLEIATKHQLIEKMLAIVANHKGVKDINRLKKDVVRREQEMSTGIGKQIAIPHAKTNAVKQPVLAFATLKNEINFDSIDNDHVKIIFFLATPEEMLAEHLKLLGRITRIVGREEIRKMLVLAVSPGEVLEIFRDEEKNFPQI